MPEPTPRLFAVALDEPWANSGLSLRGAGGSLLLHTTGIALLIAVASGGKPAVRIVSRAVSIVAPDISAWLPRTKIRKLAGGGGGGRSPLPASRGEAPPAARQQFVPPAAEVNNRAPVLTMAPTLVMAEATLPKVDMSVWGDPLARPGTPVSDGPGGHGGIGAGDGGGIGFKNGPRAGPGEGDGAVGVYRPGGGVSWPSILYKVEPEYAEEARKAKFEGMLTLTVVVDEHGLPRDFHITKPLGMGLDEKAIEAIRKWRFRPGRKDGHAVAVRVPIEVTFHLL